jgi:ribosomal protein L20
MRWEVYSRDKEIEKLWKGYYISRSDIFRVQTRRVSQTIVFRYRKSGGDCIRNIVKNSVVPT